MKYPTIKYLFALTTILFCSCTKIIEVNLNDASPRIVIEGVVNDEAGPYYVQISKTVNFSAANNFPGIDNAIVHITDNTSGTTDLLTRVLISGGLYQTNAIKGIPGHNYQLTVVAEGQTYTASCTMPQSVPLDSISFENSSFLGVINTNTVVNFKDPLGIANFYTFTEFVNNRFESDVTFIVDDRLTDGKYMRLQMYSDSTLKSKDTVTIQMKCIDKNVWNYFNALDQVTNNNAQVVSPANPTSNISNNALGYFSANTVVVKSKVVK
jgi:hypothetical protein